jgi:hypothetical protein
MKYIEMNNNIIYKNIFRKNYKELGFKISLYKNFVIYHKKIIIYSISLNLIKIYYFKSKFI